MKQSLNDVTIKSAKPSGKTITLKDGGGLFLYVEPNGSKRWRFRYRFNDKPCLLSLGLYPDVSLKQARDKRNELHAQVVAGINPSAQRKAIKAGAALNTFEAVAREWFAEHAPSCSKGTADKKISLLERDVFPWLGSQAIDSITAPDVLTVVRRLKDRGVLYTAHRALGICGQIFRYGVQTGRCVRNVTPDLRGALPQPVVKHMAAFTEPKDVARFIRSFDNFNGTYSVQCALNLMVLFFVRPVELRTARWQDMDLDAGEWRFFVGKTKVNHIVPLATQAVAILRDLHCLTGAGEYVFAVSNPNKPMSDGTINKVLRRLGWDTQTEFTGHGVRPMARTVIAEVLGVAPEAIEHQLAHRVPDALGTAYNRTKYLKERRRMMQIWADYLEKLKAGAEIIPMVAKA